MKKTFLILTVLGIGITQTSIANIYENQELSEIINSMGTSTFDRNAFEFKATQDGANKGKPGSQYNLGLLYQEGKGVRQDYSKAIEWYEKSANQGYSDAQYNLGLLYQEGKGVRQDYPKAIKWYEKSANQGYSSAQHALGVIYYNGRGVRQNSATAKEWFGKACDNGEQVGCDAYRMMNKK